MKQIIPFTKDITFKTVIGEITSISLDNDLLLNEDNLIKGNFYVKGSYKMLRSSAMKEDYSYKIPCEIAISEDYDITHSTIDIDDFNYELVNDDILRVKISLCIDNLERKEEIEVLDTEALVRNDMKEEKEDDLTLEQEKEINEKVIETILNEQNETERIEAVKKEIAEEQKTETRDMLDPINIINESNPNLLSFDNNEEYETYSIYLFKDEDTIENIMEKYKVTKYDLMDYNDLEDIKPGSKLIIPAVKNE